jgi:putative transposase
LGVPKVLINVLINPSNVLANERTFFVTASTRGKRSILQSDRAAELFIQTLHAYRRQGKYRLHEFVVMPDHFHLLITVDAGMTVERALQLVKGGFAFRAAKELGFSAPVWQKGFSEIRVFDQASFENQAKYIWSNPVVAGLVGRQEEYLFSSIGRREALDP